MTDTTVQKPAFVCIASLGPRVIAFGHEASLDAAHDWCKRARQILRDHADQVVIATLEEVHWLRVGPGWTLAPVAGWLRAGRSWQGAELAFLRLIFDHFAPGPTRADELVRVAASAPPASPSVGHEMHGVARLLVQLARGMRAVANAMNLVSRARKRVLVVDDDLVSRRLLREMLSMHHDVLEADSFSEALIELAQWDIDAVISDQELGAVGTGIDLLMEVRARWPAMRRILCTGSAQELGRAVASGIAHQVVRKPVNAQALLSSLRSS